MTPGHSNRIRKVLSALFRKRRVIVTVNEAWTSTVSALHMRMVRSCTFTQVCMSVLSLSLRLHTRWSEPPFTCDIRVSGLSAPECVARHATCEPRKDEAAAALIIWNIFAAMNLRRVLHQCLQSMLSCLLYPCCHCVCVNAKRLAVSTVISHAPPRLGALFFFFPTVRRRNLDEQVGDDRS